MQAAGRSHDHRQPEDQPAPFLGHLRQTSQDATSKEAAARAGVHAVQRVAQRSARAGQFFFSIIYFRCFSNILLIGKCPDYVPAPDCCFIGTLQWREEHAAADVKVS